MQKTVLITILLMLAACIQAPTSEQQTLNDAEKATSEKQEAQIKPQALTEEEPTPAKKDYDTLMEYNVHKTQIITTIQKMVQNSKNLQVEDEDLKRMLEEEIKQNAQGALIELDKLEQFLNANQQALATDYNIDVEKKEIDEYRAQVQRLRNIEQINKEEESSVTTKIASSKSEADILLEQCYQACEDAYDMYIQVDQCSNTCYMVAGDAKRLKSVIEIIKSVPKE